MRRALVIALVATLALVAAKPAVAVKGKPVKRAIREVFGPGWRGDAALRVAGCETGWTYRNDLVGRAGEVSAFQIHPVHWGRTVVLYQGADWNGRVRTVVITRTALRRWPRFAANVAYTMSRGGRDWSPTWTCASILGIP